MPYLGTLAAGDDEKEEAAVVAAVWTAEIGMWQILEAIHGIARLRHLSATPAPMLQREAPAVVSAVAVAVVAEQGKDFPALFGVGDVAAPPALGVFSLSHVLPFHQARHPSQGCPN